MRRVYLIIILGLAIALSISFLVSHDPGYVRISVGNLLIESNLIVLIALDLAIIVAILLSIGLIRRVKKSPLSMVQWLRHSGRSRAKQRSEKGMLAFLEGNWGEAKQLLGKSARKADNPIVNYLAAAHAANEQGDAKEAEIFLKRAYENNKESEFAVGIAQAQIQLQENRLEQGLATLIRLRKQKPHHPYILKLLKTAYLKLEDWHQLVQLLPELKRQHPEQKASLRKLERTAWQHLFAQKTEELSRSQNPHKSADILAELWQKAPESLRFNPEFIATYSQQLLQLGCHYEAEVLLRKTLSKDWHENLVELYGLTKGDKPSEQLITAENWLKQRPNDAMLLLTLGRLSLRNELWGKAWEYFLASHKLKHNRQCIAELCRLAPHISEDHKQNSALLKDLLDSLALPDLPLPK